MKKILNYSTIVYGFLLFISGIIKLNGGLATFKFYIGDHYLTIENSTSMFYIIAINLLGGASFFYHGIMTIKFQNERLTYINNKDKSIPTSEIEFTKPLSTLVFASGMYSFFISFFLFIKVITLVTSFDGQLDEYWDLMILAVLIYVPYAVIPAILVFKNVDLNRVVESNNRRVKKKF